VIPATLHARQSSASDTRDTTDSNRLEQNVFRVVERDAFVHAVQGALPKLRVVGSSPIARSLTPALKTGPVDQRTAIARRARPASKAQIVPPHIGHRSGAMREAAP
jgi:hypothetical protein